MPAYIIARLATDTPALLKDYQAATPGVIAQFGGKFLARGGMTVTFEGPDETRRIVIIEFPDLATAQTFYNSPEYAMARRLREGKAEVELIAVDGVPVK